MWHILYGFPIYYLYVIHFENNNIVRDYQTNEMQPAIFFYDKKKKEEQYD